MSGRPIRTPKLLACACLTAALCCVAGAGPAGAASVAGVHAGPIEVSDNWAGYAVTAAKPFTRVVGAWVQPHVTCESSSRRYSAFWVGIGGFTRSAHALEQIGTEADCAGAETSSYAWYELLPAGEVTIKLKIHPGDHMAASVTIDGDEVTLHLHNLSTGKSFAKTLHMASPDTSSAEWIAEAPSVCAPNGRCETLPLADFSSVTFSGATATTRGGSASPLSSPSFQLTEITLESRGVGFGHFRHVIASGAAGKATPGPLASSGSEFTVAWEQPATPQPYTPPGQPPFS